ncbi:unnamed protein product [Phytophthora fragariaefolia]|uniref:Unnamed protein product n=1 Tax=Phytophthora fragariaefolia TaxID=1490495 RepID=A0A9W6XUJ5_9STRA|nr:unnamed protein product [Phytophthora fragariaefolia]
MVGLSAGQLPPETLYPGDQHDIANPAAGPERQKQDDRVGSPVVQTSSTSIFDDRQFPLSAGSLDVEARQHESEEKFGEALALYEGYGQDKHDAYIPIEVSRTGTLDGNAIAQPAVASDVTTTVLESEEKFATSLPTSAASETKLINLFEENDSADDEGGSGTADDGDGGVQSAVESEVGAHDACAVPPTQEDLLQMHNYITSIPTRGHQAKCAITRSGTHLYHVKSLTAKKTKELLRLPLVHERLANLHARRPVCVEPAVDERHVLQEVEWPAEIAHVEECIIPAGLAFSDIGDFGKCCCVGDCFMDTCENAACAVYCIPECWQSDQAMKNNSGYTMLYNTMSVGGKFVYVEALECGFTTRFISHACEPNAAFVEVHNRTRVKVLVRMIKDVKAGTQITVDYGDEMWFKCACDDCWKEEDP